jgi:hypothetical protein
MSFGFGFSCGFAFGSDKTKILVQKKLLNEISFGTEADNKI